MARCFHLPLYAYRQRALVRAITSEAELIAEWPLLMTGSVRDVIAHQGDDLFWNSDGCMLARGDVWFARPYGPDAGERRIGIVSLVPDRSEDWFYTHFPLDAAEQ